MKKLKYLGLYLLILLPTFFINFYEIIFNRCFSLRVCMSDGFNLPVFTNYPNFFMKANCGGITGKICSPEHFSFAQLTFDIIFALLIFGTILLIAFILSKIFPEEVTSSVETE